jgi:hypothetical protein
LPPLLLPPPHSIVALRLTPLRSVWCSQWACRLVLFHTVAHSSFAATPAPLNPNKVFAIAHSFFKRGQPPLSVCARLRVARANRAVTVFACFVSFFCPTLLAVFAVFPLVIPLRYIPAAHTAKHCLSQSKSRHTFSTFRCATFRSFLPALAFPAKKLHFTAKTCASPAASGRQPQPSFRCATLRAICVCHPRSTRRRLAPLHSTGKKSLRYTPPIFYLFRSGSRLFYLRCFVLRPRTAPDHPPLKQLKSHFICVPRRF